MFDHYAISEATRKERGAGKLEATTTKSGTGVLKEDGMLMCKTELFGMHISRLKVWKGSMGGHRRVMRAVLGWMRWLNTWPPPTGRSWP